MEDAIGGKYFGRSTEGGRFSEGSLIEVLLQLVLCSLLGKFAKSILYNCTQVSLDT